MSQKRFKRVYIAGPMTGIPEFNFPAFHAAAARLRAVGYEVVSPAEVATDTSIGWEAAMRADIRELMTCDGIALLPGWENSRGAMIEVNLASNVGIQSVPLQDLLANTGAPS